MVSVLAPSTPISQCAHRMSTLYPVRVRALPLCSFGVAFLCGGHLRFAFYPRKCLAKDERRRVSYVCWRLQLQLFTAVAYAAHVYAAPRLSSSMFTGIAILVTADTITFSIWKEVKTHDLYHRRTFILKNFDRRGTAGFINRSWAGQVIGGCSLVILGM